MKALRLCLLTWLGLGGPGAADPLFRLQETELVIPQVDYEPAIYYRAGDPLPHLDFDRVGWERVVEKQHRAVVIETEYIRLTVLPQLGRVYSLFYRPTGHELLWRNDIVRPGGANNDTGWWLWIGGIEYTLPGDEHGTTWAMPWSYQVVEDSPARKAVRLQVREPTTLLEERIELSVFPHSAGFEADIRIWNPTADTVHFAHWVNPMWTPGGRNELTDSTEFIIPTQQILIEERWQANLGPSPQQWAGNPLRHIRGWKMGDIMADGLLGGFFSAYAHEAEEGVVRVFDPLVNPGVDVWTYGFHPQDIPMGSGAPNKGYVEMWGGTVSRFPDERRPLAPGASLAWSEWIYPYQQTGGLTHAGRAAAVNCRLLGEKLWIDLCPAQPMEQAVLEVRAGGRIAERRPFQARPDQPLRAVIDLGESLPPAEVLAVVYAAGSEVLRCRAAGGAQTQDQATARPD